MYAVNPADNMEEDGDDEYHAVNSVENAAMTANDHTHVLDTDIPLDIADHQITQLAADADDQPRYHEEPRFEVGKREPQQPRHHQRHAYRTD